MSVPRYVNRSDVATYVDANFLQLFLWKRFGALSPIQIEFKPAKPQKILVDGLKRRKNDPPEASRIEVVWGYMA